MWGVPPLEVDGDKREEVMEQDWWIRNSKEMIKKLIMKMTFQLIFTRLIAANKPNKSRNLIIKNNIIFII